MTLHRINSAQIVQEHLRRVNAKAINAGHIPALIGNQSNHFLMNDAQANLAIFIWTGPGVYNLICCYTNDARLKPAVAEAIAYIKAQGCKVLWAAERAEDPGSVFIMRAFGMINTSKTAFVADGVKPIWRRGFA